MITKDHKRTPWLWEIPSEHYDHAIHHVNTMIISSWFVRDTMRTTWPWEVSYKQNDYVEYHEKEHNYLIARCQKIQRSHYGGLCWKAGQSGWISSRITLASNGSPEKWFIEVLGRLMALDEKQHTWKSLDVECWLAIAQKHRCSLRYTSIRLP